MYIMPLQFLNILDGFWHIGSVSYIEWYISPLDPARWVQKYRNTKLTYVRTLQNTYASVSRSAVSLAQRFPSLSRTAVSYLSLFFPRYSAFHNPCWLKEYSQRSRGHCNAFCISSRHKTLASNIFNPTATDDALLSHSAPSGRWKTTYSIQFLSFSSDDCCR